MTELMTLPSKSIHCWDSQMGRCFKYLAHHFIPLTETIYLTLHVSGEVQHIHTLPSLACTVQYIIPQHVILTGVYRESLLVCVREIQPLHLIITCMFSDSYLTYHSLLYVPERYYFFAHFLLLFVCVLVPSLYRMPIWLFASYLHYGT